jgi:hypothetical protein
LAQLVVMKSCRAAFVLLLLVALSRLPAQDDEWKATTGIGCASERVFRGVERSGGAAQASAEITGYGFEGSIWTSQPFKGGEPGETDLSAGYAFKIPGQFTLEATVTQYLFAMTKPGATRRSTEAGLQASWTANSSLTAAIACFHDFRLGADTVQATAGYSVALKRVGAYLELKSFAGWVNGTNLRPDATGPRLRDAYGYYGADAQLPYRVGGHTTFVAGVHFSEAVGQSRLWSPIGVPGGARTWASFAVNFDF